MFFFTLSAVLLISAFILAGLRRPSGSGGSFALGGRSESAAGVAGVLMGAIVGGASTVGTVQMAYTHGLSAWWFTIGAGVGCLLLALRFAEPLRLANVTTISEYLGNAYGRPVALIATISSTLGTFISLISQYLASTALIGGLLPIGTAATSILTAAAIFGFIASGGIKSFSRLGRAKIILLYVVMILCAAAALRQEGNVASVAAFYLNEAPLFGRPFAADAGALVSLVVGVFSTQIYIQAIFSAKDGAAARKGSMISAAAIPPLGALGVWIGMSVRASGVDIDSSSVFSWFILHHFPPVIGGVLWGAILVTAIASAAGLALGISTNIVCDFGRYGKAGDEAAKNRVVLIVLLAVAASLSIVLSGSMILTWSYLSMGLRGAGTFIPFLCALLKPDSLPPRWAAAASATGLIAMIAAAFTHIGGDPLFPGLAVSLALSAAGMALNRKKISSEAA